MFTTLNAEDLALAVNFSETVRLAAVAGFDAVDLPMEEMLADDTWTAGRVQEELDRGGVRAAGWWLPIEYRYDRNTYEDGLAELPRAAALAAAVGATWCNTWMWPFSDQLPFPENYDLHRKRLGEVARTLQTHSCVLGLEFVGPATMRVGHPHAFICSLPGTLELISDIGEPNVGVLLDCWQWYTSHGAAGDLGSLAPGQVTYVHLNDAPTGRAVDEQIDAERMLPGATGVIDIVAFMEALKALEFDGPVAVEPYNADVNRLAPEERSRVARQSLRAVLTPDGEETPAA